MLLNLLNPSNYVSYNVTLANVLGLHAAIYLSELLSINDKAVRKKKLNNNYFTIDREYITQQTTLSVKEQMQIDEGLLKISVLKKDNDNPNMLMLNITTLTSIIMSEDEQLIKNITKTVVSKSVNPSAKKTQREIQRDTLKKLIYAPNLELRAAYEGWVDGVYANPNGFLSKRAIEIFQKKVDEFANHNLDTALKVIEIATVGGYRDAEWAINSFTKNYNIKYCVAPTATVSTEKPVLSKEIF